MQISLTRVPSQAPHRSLKTGQRQGIKPLGLSGDTITFGQNAAWTEKTHLKGQLYESFSKTPAGVLLAFLKKIPDAKKPFEAQRTPQLDLFLKDVQAHYGMHLNGYDTLIALKIDPISQLLATPEKTQRIRKALETPQVQVALKNFYPKEQLKALKTLVSDPEEFEGFAQEMANTLTQSGLYVAGLPGNPLRALFYAPRKSGPPLINDFDKLFDLFRPTLQDKVLQENRRKGIACWDMAGQIASHYFPPQPTHALAFSSLLAETSDLETQERLLKLASGRSFANHARLQNAGIRYQHHGGKALAAFFNKQDPSGTMGTRLINLLIEAGPFESNADQARFRQSLRRFLTLSSEFILSNPDVPAQQKLTDIKALIQTMDDQPAFAQTWSAMQGRYPLFPSAKIETASSSA